MSPAQREAVVLSAALLAYSNGLALVAMRRGGPADVAYRWTNPPFLLVLLLVLARVRRVPLGRLLGAAGYRRAGLRRALAGGLLAGGLLAGPPLLFFARPLVLDAPLEYGPIAGLSPAGFWWRIAVELAVGVALFEETVFRGLLFDAWARAADRRTAHLATAATFAAWHCAVSVDTMQRTNIAAAAVRLPRPLRPHANRLAVAGALLTTGVAGLLFAALRHAGRGSIWGPVLAHWIVDASMVTALWRRSRRSAAGSRP